MTSSSSSASNWSQVGTSLDFSPLYAMLIWDLGSLRDASGYGELLDIADSFRVTKVDHGEEWTRHSVDWNLVNIFDSVHSTFPAARARSNI